MDWDSPTTKKHIAEAEAQGCELLGAGKDRFYRLYRLPCVHEKEVDIRNMRKGTFRCQTCIDNKLIAEAEAQSCELLGPGKNCQYRTYRLPCGHEQEVSTGCMRTGQVRCRECLAERFAIEAKNQGCELIGLGRNKACRTYRLPCGHEQEIQLGDMRRGQVRCKTCLEKKLETEAEAQGCELLGKGQNSTYRTYHLECGHNTEVQTPNMRKGNFRCQRCLDERLKREAREQDCVLLGPGKNRKYRTYRLPCGHEQEIQPGGMRRGSFNCEACFYDRVKADAEIQGCIFLGRGVRKNYGIYRLPCGHKREYSMSAMRWGNIRCQTCLDNRLKEEAEAQGCELLGPGTHSRNHRTYRLSCGHEQEVETSNMRVGNFRCHACLLDKLKKEAEKWDCVFLGKAKKPQWRTYRLNCGHEQEIHTSAMRMSVFRCQTCDEYAFTRPSDAYLLHIKVGSDEWLKLGYTNNLEYRVSQYALPLNAEWSALAILPFDTGLEAMRFEKALHTKYQRKRLRAQDMLIFHTGSGSTECYPLTMVETLMAEFVNAGE